MKMQKNKIKMNERRQEYDINVMAGPGRIECVKVEAPLRLLEKSAGCRMREEGKKRKERGLTCVIYVSRHEGFQPLIT